MKKNIINIVFIIFLITFPIILYCEQFSIKFNNFNKIDYKNNKNNYDFLIKHLTTKTPYYNNIENNKINNLNISNDVTCKIISNDMVLRHGNRYPEAKILKKFEKLKKEISNIKNFINDSEFEWLKNYEIPYTKEMVGELVPLGIEEHYNISKRLLKKYPDYFDQYKPQEYGLYSTVIPRTGMSASSFSYGLFEGTGPLPGKFQPIHIQTSKLENDNFLSFFLNCKKYINKLNDGSISENEEEKWKEMKYPNIALEISQRLGIQDKWVPSNSIVQSIFLSCIYQVAIENITDQFCSLLSKENILDWEYSKDLSAYWVNSYGNEVNYEISSLLLKDIILHFDNMVLLNNNSIKEFKNMENGKVINDFEENFENFITDGYSRNIYRFGHSETIVPFISLLGLFKDDYHLYANSTMEDIRNRKFKTSVIVPYSTNIGLYLFDCGQEEGYKILVEHNESPILIPGCGNYYCNFDLFKLIFSKVLLFNWEEYCDINENGYI